MLQTIREKLTGTFAVIILGLIALTLVLTFGNIDTGFTGAGVAATVNGEDIPLNDFRRVYNRERQQWEANFRAQIPDVIAQGLADQVVDSLVRNKVVASHVRDAGYRAGDADVRMAIETNPAFQVGGSFSQPAYENLLSTQGLSVARFEYEQRQNMQMTDFVEGIGYTGFYTPAEFRRYIELDGETRNVRYAILSADSRRGDVTVTDEEVAAYYEANRGNYLSEESATVEYIALDFDSILEQTDVTDDEARAYYESNPQEFAGPDERRASHILIPVGDDEDAARELAESLRQRLVDGEAFADLAAEYSADSGSATSGGDLGWLGADDSPAPEFEEALFELQRGEVSEPVRTEFGFHLIRLTDTREGSTLTFDDVRDSLVLRLAEAEAADAYGELVDELDERALESLDGLAPVAESMGLELGRVESFTRAGAEPLGFAPNLIDAVFSLEVLEDGENSPVIDLGDGRAVVVRVAEYRPAEPLPLEAVAEEIREQLVSDQAISLTARQGGELLENLESGASADDLELPEGTDWQTVQQLRRGADELPPDLAAAVFRAPKPGNEGTPVYQGMPLSSGDFALYAVTAWQPGSPELYSTEDRDLRKEQLADRQGGFQATAVVESLVEDARVNVAPDLLGTEAGDTLL